MSGIHRHRGTDVTTRTSSPARKPVGRKRPRRRPGRHAPDGFSIVIPASWKVPGAQAAPTMPNKKRSERSLRATASTVPEIATSGAEVPSPLFRATAPDDTSGVTIGVYDVGIDIDVGSLRQAICKALPDPAAITEVAVSRVTGLEVVRPAVPTSDGAGWLFAMDVWVEVPSIPGWVAVLRFWRARTAWDDEAAALEQFMVSSFLFLLPGQFRGRFNRWTIRRGRYFEPPDRADLSAPAEDGRRAAGWRLGVVFHTAQLDEKKLMFFTFTGRPADEVLGLAVAAAWMVFVFAVLARHSEGAGEWALYGGTGPITAWARGLRRGRRSVFGLLATLAATAGVGLLLG